jgi:hypothetical protein
VKRIVLIGSMQPRYRDLMEQARRHFGAPGVRCIAPYDTITPADLIPARGSRPNAIVNTALGHWHTVVERADEVVVVRKPDGTVGDGTDAELRHARAIGKKISWAPPPAS